MNELSGLINGATLVYTFKNNLIYSKIRHLVKILIKSLRSQW